MTLQSIGQNALERSESETVGTSIRVTLFLTVVAAAATFNSFRYALKIKFGPIDDHEIFKFLGSQRGIRWFDIPNILWNKTEIGKWGTSPRYRPSYYTIRVLETKMFGDNPVLWYGLRIGLVAVVIFLLTSVALQLANLRQPKLKALCGVISILTFLSLNAWRDIILRLGPSEFYLSVGYALFLYLLLLNIQKPKSTTLVALLVSLIVVVGSKENGISLLFPFLLLLLYLVCNQAVPKKIAYFSGLFSVVFVAFIFLGLNKAISRTGADVYGNQRSLAESVQLAVDYIKTSDFLRASSLLLVVLLCALMHRNRHGINSKIQIVAPMFAGFFVLQIVFEHVFYKGNFPVLRYTLVTEISKTLLLLMAVFSAIGLIVDVVSKLTFKTEVACLALLVLLFPTTYSKYDNSVTSNKKVALDNAETTSAYQKKIETIVNALDGNYSSVVIQLNNIWDYEPASAVIRYLQFYGRNPIFFLNLQIPSVQPGNESALLAQLTEYERYGSELANVTPGPSEFGNVKPRPSELGNNNFCVVFYGASGLPDVCRVSYDAS